MTQHSSRPLSPSRGFMGEQTLLIPALINSGTSGAAAGLVPWLHRCCISPTACKGFDFCSEFSAHLWGKTEFQHQRQAVIPTFLWNDFGEVLKNSCNNLLTHIWTAQPFFTRVRVKKGAGVYFVFISAKVLRHLSACRGKPMKASALGDSFRSLFLQFTFEVGSQILLLLLHLLLPLSPHRAFTGRR